MSARTTEISRIKSPIKKQIQHLGGDSQKKFPELLEKIVVKLRDKDFKLFHVTKTYRKKGTIRSDNFWRKETRIKNIKVVWLCTLTIIFDNGIDFQFDFDYWFEFSKFLQNLRSDIYELGFPFSSRSYAKRFGKKEATRSLEEVEKAVGEVMKNKTDGWGIHGVKKKITDRKSVDICHKKEFKLSSISELDKLRNSLTEIIEEPIDVAKESKDEIEKTSQEKLEELIPFEISPNSLEGYSAFFLWFRNPGGGFEYQLYRFIQENYGKIVEKEKIRDALLRLEVHGYANVKETPQNLKRKMREKGIRRYSRFYEVGREDFPGKKIFNELKNKTNIGAYLYPISRKQLIKKVDAPSHLVENKIKKLTRKNYLSKRKVKDFLGRTVRKIKPQRDPRKATRLENKIMKEAKEFYDIQKECLDQMQKGRP